MNSVCRTVDEISGRTVNEMYGLRMPSELCGSTQRLETGGGFVKGQGPSGCVKSCCALTRVAVATQVWAHAGRPGLLDRKEHVVAVLGRQGLHLHRSRPRP